MPEALRFAKARRCISASASEHATTCARAAAAQCQREVDTAGEPDGVFVKRLLVKTLLVQRLTARMYSTASSSNTIGRGAPPLRAREAWRASCCSMRRSRAASRADDGEGRPAASPAATATSSSPPAEVRGVSEY